ncbi:MAG TPA: glycoside-pentoside-hexuronide (GPH):cation symporter [Chthoniobacteraceae bacterium]|nr:glycoside-pentoside-hexuronide (GPH):cation symporter [Chthoniobacteraceae bacterium]
MSTTPPPASDPNTKLPKLTFLEKFGFGSGDLASNLIWQSGGIFQNFFYTDIFRLAPGAVAMVMLFSRVFDGFVDVAVGAWADRTNTKWGKFRPFIIWWVLPVALVFVMNYTVPPKSWDMHFFDVPAFHFFGYPVAAAPITGYLVYAWFTSALLMSLYSVINIPYGALSGVMTNEPHDRNSLGAFRMGLANVGGLIIAFFINPLIRTFGRNPDGTVDKAKGCHWAVMLFAGLFIFFFLLTFFTCKERIQPPPAQKTKFKDDFATLFRNKPWVIMSLFAIINMTLVFLRLGDMSYYFHYSIGLMDAKLNQLTINLGLFQITWLTKEDFLWAWGSISFVIGTFFTKGAVKMFGKVNANIIATALSGILLVPFYFVPPGGVSWVLIITFVSQFFGGIAASLYWSMLGDIADFSEWKFKSRNTGLIFSSTTFAQKMGIAIGGGGILNVILWKIGYQPDIVQPANVVHGINVMMGLIPGIGTFLIAFLFLGYELDDAFLKQMREDLAARRAGRPAEQPA